MDITTEVGPKMTTIELKPSNQGSRIKSLSKGPTYPTLRSRIKYTSTTRHIRAIKEAIRKLAYWKGEGFRFGNI